jgi:hypothetical protein
MVDGLQDSIARLCLSSASTEKHQPVAADTYAESLGEMKGRVWVTGDPAGVMNAKEILSRLVFAKVSRDHEVFVLSSSAETVHVLQRQTVFTKEAAVIPGKLDWVVSQK